MKSVSAMMENSSNAKDRPAQSGVISRYLLRRGLTSFLLGGGRVKVNPEGKEDKGNEIPMHS